MFRQRSFRNQFRQSSPRAQPARRRPDTHWQIWAIERWDPDALFGFLDKGLLGFHFMRQRLFMSRLSSIWADAPGRVSCLNRLTFIFTAPAAFTAFILATPFEIGRAH